MNRMIVTNNKGTEGKKKNRTENRGKNRGSKKNTYENSYACFQSSEKDELGKLVD